MGVGQWDDKGWFENDVAVGGNNSRHGGTCFACKRTVCIYNVGLSFLFNAVSQGRWLAAAVHYLRKAHAGLARNTCTAMDASAGCSHTMQLPALA